MHLKKLFAGIHTVEFNSDSTAIMSMNSSAGEKVQFKEIISVEDEVEEWLSALTKNMQATLQGMLMNCLKEKGLQINSYPS